MSRMVLNKKRIIPICCMAASLVVMILPYGIPSRSTDGPPDWIVYTNYYSYFSFFVIGASGNLFPMMTALLSILVLLRLFIRTDSLGNLICLCICLLASLLSWVIFGVISVIGVIVFILHLATLALQINCRKTSGV